MPERKKNLKQDKMSKIKDLLARAISLASEQPMSYKEAIELLDGIDTCKVKIWLEKGAKLPEYAHKEDACMDLFVKNIELDRQSHISYWCTCSAT